MYKVFLSNIITKEETICICETRQELSNLILHLDIERYEIIKIIADTVIYDNYKTFIKEDPDLEIGVEKNN